MTDDRKTARALCTASEYQLFAASLGRDLAALQPAQLKAKIERTRKLRDKFRDLFKRQRLANRARTGTKKGAAPRSNERTDEKAQLFAAALARFTTRAAELEAAKRRASAAHARQATGKKATRPAGKKGPKVARSPKAPRRGPLGKGLTDAKSRSMAKTPNQALLGHVRAAGQRRQARRDSRR